VKVTVFTQLAERHAFSLRHERQFTRTSGKYERLTFLKGIAFQGLPELFCLA